MSGSAPGSGKSTPLPQQSEPSGSSSSMKIIGRKTSGVRSNSNSRSNSRSNSVERRKSGDDTVSPTRKNALFDAFRPRSKSDASKTRKPSIIANMKTAVQVSHYNFILKQFSSSLIIFCHIPARKVGTLIPDKGTENLFTNYTLQVYEEKKKYRCFC